MATSTPAPPDSGAAHSPAPRHEALATIVAQVAAVDTLIGLARHSIRVFDFDLSEMGWNDPARAEKLVAFLRGSTAARLEIVVHDTRWIEQSCPRLTNLLKHWSHAMTIGRTGEEAKRATDPLLIVDGRHFLHRFHYTQPRAALAFDDPHAARPLVERWDEISALAEPGITATTLGL